MKKFITGIIIGLMFTCGVSYGYRIGKPVPINEINANTLIELNHTIEKLWNITNGKYSLNIVTTNPDGNSNGDTGDMLLFNNSGTYYLAVNTTGAKVWRSVQLTDTP